MPGYHSDAVEKSDQAGNGYYTGIKSVNVAVFLQKKETAKKDTVSCKQRGGVDTLCLGLEGQNCVFTVPRRRFLIAG